MAKPGFRTSRRRRIEHFKKIYNRSPTINELRALKALPIKKFKRLNDTSEKGKRIDQLLRKCFEDHDWSVLEEAGQLLWEQVFRQPEPDEKRYQSIEYFPTLSDDSSPDDSSSESESPKAEPAVARKVGARPVLPFRSIKTQSGNPAHHQTTSYTAPALPQIMDHSKSQAGSPLQGQFPIRGLSVGGNDFQSRSGSIGQLKPSPFVGQQHYQYNPPRDMVPQSSLACSYVGCKRSKKNPFKTAATLATHVRKYHAEDEVEERGAIETFQETQYSTTNTGSVDSFEGFLRTGGILSKVQEEIAVAVGNMHGEMRDLRSEQTDLKRKLQDTAIQNTGLRHQINWLERQQPVPTWQGTQAHSLYPADNIQPRNSPTWPEAASPQPRSSYQVAPPSMQFHQNAAYHGPYTHWQGYQDPSAGPPHQQQPVPTWSGFRKPSDPSARGTETNEEYK